MNILVLSSAFRRPYYNARLRSQCDYLTKQGHHVEVYTELWDTLKFKHKYAIHEIGDPNTEYWKWLLTSIYALFTNYKERKFAYQVLWRSRKVKFDVIYCSTDSCFPLGAAVMLAKMKNLSLHVDLWDLQELVPNYVHHPWWHPIKAIRQKLYTKRRNNALKQANMITTISPKHVEIVRQINPKVELMFNGFDSNRFNYQPVKTDVFRINFFGFAYTSQRIDMILHVMDKFRNELPKAQWMFYSPDLNYNHFKYAMPNTCGILPDEVMPNALHQASIVLLFNDTEDNGLNYEQFYQALGAERPVLFTNEPDGAIPDLIAYTNAGLATNSVKKCMNYIRDLYDQWEQNGHTHLEVKNKDQFDSLKQHQRLEQLLSMHE